MFELWTCPFFIGDPESPLVQSQGKFATFIIPRACARGKVIGCVVVMSTKITISRDVGI